MKKFVRLNDRLWFGKYKGQRIIDVIKGDKGYVIGLEENHNIEFDKKIHEHLSNRGLRKTSLYGFAQPTLANEIYQEPQDDFFIERPFNENRNIRNDVVQEPMTARVVNELGLPNQQINRNNDDVVRSIIMRDTFDNMFYSIREMSGIEFEFNIKRNHYRMIEQSEMIIFSTIETLIKQNFSISSLISIGAVILDVCKRLDYNNNMINFKVFKRDHSILISARNGDGNVNSLNTIIQLV